ncbi:hypothetical protein [Nonomuraea cavernae]|uniref:Uncharacterized protein n=1 Tax=Nonomuraea cavernae TaxID=2045107 RepID=A0A917YUZ2_9ACTN|nr:hypothetical protein [Nonomuraea cavernae]MCA2186948.1 hypothetical protein [Nonomuraea cavernae]GGO67098.1 hypothetical protein GCM10012289_22710 [Nonomuraea cavernae]
MISVLLHLMVFAAGFLACELVRICQERYRLRQAVRSTVQTAGSPDMVLRIWSGHRANWCDRPGCPRCWGRWGR